jgi:hypothetical protein
MDEEVSVVSSIRELAVNGLTPPSDFPVEDFEAIYTRMTPHGAHQAHPRFVGAWRAISYRYMAMIEYDAQFTESITRDGPNPSNQIRYQQERDLFNFFSNGVSIFDAFCFGAFAIGAHTGSTAFRLPERKVDWERLIKAYTKSFGSDPIIDVLNEINMDGALSTIRDVRHYLMHRAVPPRQIGIASGPGAVESPSTIERLNLTLDQNTTNSLRTGALVRAEDWRNIARGCANWRERRLIPHAECLHS